MDFVERLFGISPDGGSGAYEALLFLIPFLCLGAIYLTKRFARSRRL